MHKYTVDVYDEDKLLCTKELYWDGKHYSVKINFDSIVTVTKMVFKRNGKYVKHKYCNVLVDNNSRLTIRYVK